MNVFGDICEGLRGGKKVFLSTIVRSSGSVPAPVHSRMVVIDDGRLTAKGSVGGGCLDAAVMRTVKNGAGVTGAVVERFELNDAFGETEFTCGGSVSILTEPLRPDMLSLFERLEEAGAGGRDCVMRTVVTGDGRTRKALYDTGGAMISAGGEDAGHDGTVEIIRSLGPRTPAHTVAGKTGEEFFEFIEADPPLVIFGGGHVGRAIAGSAVPAGFNVTVVEDRPEFAAPERFPGGRAVLCRRFDLALESVRLTPKSFVVIVTRGHRHDEQLLGMCVRENLRYLGMIGSRKKVALVFEHLMDAGTDPGLLARVHAPIGLPIGAHTAGEIAVSVLAEMISVRRSSGPVGVPSGRVR